LNFKKQFFIHPNLLTLSKTSFKNFASGSAVDAKKKYLGLLEQAQ